VQIKEYHYEEVGTCYATSGEVDTFDLYREIEKNKIIL
jgi:hypothetical protein